MRRVPKRFPSAAPGAPARLRWRGRMLVVGAVACLAPAAALAQSGAIVGTPGDDTLTGGAGPDTIFGLAGNDRLSGGGGNDDLGGGPGADDLRGGSGTDAALYGGVTVPVAVTLDNVANDGTAGEGDNVHDDVEQIYGGSAGDRLTGDAKANLIDGGPGDDSITDGGGIDRVYGGSGDDVVTTFDGSVDIVDCGPGRDTVTSDRSDVLIGCEKRLPPKRVTSPIAYAFFAKGGRTTVTSLVVSQIPRGGRVEVRCRGGGCAFAATTLPAGRSRVDLKALFRGRSLAAGATIDVRVSAPGSIGKVRRFQTRAGALPRTTLLCLPPEAHSPQRRC